MQRFVIFGFRVSLAIAAVGCGAHTEARAVKEAAAPMGLSYTLQIDATRLSRGTGLQPVPAVTQLIEENLAAYFKVGPPAAASLDAVVLLAESPAPGYGVRVRVEARPDDYCFVRLEAVRLSTTEPSGGPQPVELAPYSVHYGLSMARAALASLRGPNRPALSKERFDALRAQAAALAKEGRDPPIDEATYAHTARPLERLDEPPRYVSPLSGERRLSD